MTTRAARTTWKGHELVTKAIFEALLKQSNAQNLEIKHNAKIPGLKVGHQIDVYWKFSMGGIDHFVIVEVKRKKAKASQGDLLKFSAVLSDIPGQPRGVFVSQNGYQRGAVNVARAQGIEVFEIKEVSQDSRREHVTMTNLSIAMLTVKSDSAALELTILTPTISAVRFSVDVQWIKQHPEIQVDEIQKGVIPSLAQFIDAAGNVRTTMQKLVQDCVKEFGQIGQTSFQETFPEPTFVDGLRPADPDGKPIEKLKVLGVVATLDIVKTTRTSPLFHSDAATYLFKNAVESDHRYVLIREGESDLEAALSSPIRQFRIG